MRSWNSWKALAAAAALLLPATATRAQAVDAETHERAARDLERWRELKTNARTSSPGAAGDAGAQGGAVHRHLGGFFRLDTGVAWMQVSGKDASGETGTLTGVGGTGGLHAGYAVAEDLIVGLQVFGALVQNPTLKSGGQSITTSDTSLMLTAAGLELNWYASPSNVYVSLTPGIARLSWATTGEQTIDTDWGLAARVAVGKEWWVSDHWGLGLVLSGIWAQVSKKDTSLDKATTWIAGLGFSATYN